MKTLNAKTAKKLAIKARYLESTRTHVYESIELLARTYGTQTITIKLLPLEELCGYSYFPQKLIDELRSKDFRVEYLAGGHYLISWE